MIWHLKKKGALAVLITAAVTAVMVLVALAVSGVINWVSP